MSCTYFNCKQRRKFFRGRRRCSVDGAVIILLILAKQILELLEGDINFLEFPKIIKKSLKTLKATLGVFNAVKNNTKSKLSKLYVLNNSS